MMRLKELVQGLTIEQMIQVVEQMPEDTQFWPVDCHRCVVAQVLQSIAQQPIWVSTGLAGDLSRFTSLTRLLRDIIYDFDHQFTWDISKQETFNKQQTLEFLRQEMEMK